MAAKQETWKLKEAADLDTTAQGLMHSVLREHHSRLVNQTIVVLFRPKPRIHKGFATIGHATATGERERLLAQVDGCITIAWSWWQKATTEQREALLDHELSHFDVGEKSGRLGTVGHDVEEFISVWRRRGAWIESLRQAEKALQQLRLPIDEDDALPEDLAVTLQAGNGEPVQTTVGAMEAVAADGKIHALSPDARASRGFTGKVRGMLEEHGIEVV